MSQATSLSARIEKASKTIEVYFEHPDSYIEETLKHLGVDDTEIGLATLEDYVSYEDFSELFNQRTNNKVPLPRLKMLWAILKPEKKPTNVTPTSSENSSLEMLVKTIKPIQQWSNQDLLEQYSKDGQYAVHDELVRRSKGRFVIIFGDNNGDVDIENSMNMLKKAQFQDTPQIYKLKSGDIREVYRVGEFPLSVLHECPLHKDVLLLDGYCEECATHWDTSDQEKNVFLRMAFEQDTVFAKIHSDKEFSELIKLFPKVYLKYKTLAEEGKLPSLKRRISKSKDGDPFRVVGTHKTY
jgi:hypothetical protein